MLSSIKELNFDNFDKKLFKFEIQNVTESLAKTIK